MKTSRSIYGKTPFLLLSLFINLLFVLSPSVFAGTLNESLSLKRAIQLAQQNDPWLAENKHLQQALESKSIAAGTLPDPRVSLGLANIAADSLDFNQENMTQLRAGISQMFPRGDTLRLQTQRFKLLSSQNPFLRDDRKKQVSLMVTTLWLDVFKAKESIRLIENDRELFEQLVDISEASYSTAYGNTQQQDVVRAQLELTRLDDRLTQLKQEQEVANMRLMQWVSGRFTNHYTDIAETENLPKTFSNIESDTLPMLSLNRPELLTMQGDTETLTTLLLKHPSVLALDSLINVSSTDIELSKQKYKPEWGVNAEYGYRGDNNLGNNRSDLLSIGLSFDVPLFTATRQDKQVQAAISEAESVKTKKWLLLRKMISEFETAKVELVRRNERYDLYQQKLLPQIYEQAEAALTAYTNDAGDFAEVVRARIDVLNAEIDNLGIEVERQKNIAQLNYFLSSYNTADVTNVKGHP